MSDRRSGCFERMRPRFTDGKARSSCACFFRAMNGTEYLWQIGVFAFCCTDRGFLRFRSPSLRERLDDSHEVGLPPPSNSPRRSSLPFSTSSSHSLLLFMGFFIIFSRNSIEGMAFNADRRCDGSLRVWRFWPCRVSIAPFCR